MRYKTIYIAGINRSGGSLLSRLFDGHPDILSYPTELGFPINNNFYEITDSYSGVPQTIPDINFNENNDFYSILDIPKQKHEYSTTWGKETADPLGVRDNYLEKNFYGNVEAHFDYNKFTGIFDKLAKKANSIEDLYNARHQAYFTAWDNGKHIKNQSAVVMQDSGGIYLTNIDKFFSEFHQSILIYPLRDLMGYVAAEKVRYARRFFGSRRFAFPQLPNYFVKQFDHYDINAQIKGWLCALTRVRILQEKYGLNQQFIVYSHNILTSYPKETMKRLSELCNIKYTEDLLRPTIGNKNWLGNSHYGPTKGISNKISANYPKVLTKNEISTIKLFSDNIDMHLTENKTPVNLLSIPQKYLYEYKRQKKYFNETEKLSLYYALSNATKRRYHIKQVPYYSFFAIIYSIFVRIVHIPRMFKLKYFKAKGKQNYT